MPGFHHALRGLAFLIRSQSNARIHICFTVAALGLGYLLHISVSDWCWMIIAVSSVWSAEAFNTAIERLADRVTTERDPLIKQAKDLAAAAVLITAVSAATVGFIVLGPPLWRWLVP
jgi:diacylglycerol kinase